MAVGDNVAADSAADRHQFGFTGGGNEFAGIWFKNLLLTILTLGIYSAWATVRTRRYLYGCTRLMDSSFDYHAHPLTILKGRALILAVLIVYGVVEYLASELAAALLGVLALIFPILALRALRFRRVNSSWRGVRFGFAGTQGEATVAFLFLPLLSAVTLGALYPYTRYCQQQFIIAKSRFGASPVDLHSNARNFYKIYLKVLGLAASLMVLLYLAWSSLLETSSFADAGLVLGVLMPAMMLASMAAMYVIYTVANTMVLNEVWNNAAINDGDVRFVSRLSAMRMCWIGLTNALLIIVTLGIYFPWARIRMTRYRIACMQAVARQDDVDALVAAGERQQVSAVGDEGVDWVGPEVGAL